MRAHATTLLLAILTLGVSACSGDPGAADGLADAGGEGELREDVALNHGGAGSTETPRPGAVCGNGKLEPGELCDDGNQTAGDGCSADCAEQDPDFDCSVPGEPCIDRVVCGNGVLEGDEACDDANETDEDGCAADCGAIEEGYACLRPGTPCLPVPVCGNGIRERGEGCDDGEAIPSSGDGCSAECQLEDGYHCAGTQCSLIACGDGFRTPNEQCDDGNAIADDGCSGSCVIEAGFRCSSSGCQPKCGDGLVVADESCDDGNRFSGDGCSAACIIEPFYACSGTPSSCQTTIRCGNQVVEPGEICDPPGSDGCLDGCESFSPNVSGGAVCGNNVIESGEQCDPPAEGAGCTAGCLEEAGWSCSRPGECFRLPTCGDGVLHFDLGEQCDDGDDSDANDGCHACEVGAGFVCTGLEPSVCVQEICGNGERTPGEECDDGNSVASDGCSNCFIDAGWLCPIDGVACIERCGDGRIVGDEECDDGNTISDDGCNAGCRVEPGFTCPQVDATCIPSACGDGIKDPDEGCDDGNRVAADGCGPTCQLEPSITPGPDPVVDVFCGDGLITGSEECDDGNTEDHDGCAANCVVEAGFECVESLDLPSEVEIALTYRDFKVAEAPGGHPDFEFQYGSQTDGAAGAACMVSNRHVCGQLDSEGKPVANVDVVGDDEGDDTHGATRIKSPQSFAIWYRDAKDSSDENVNSYAGYHGTVAVKKVSSTLMLTRQEATDTYVFDDSTFLPLNGASGAFGPTLQDGASEAAGCDSDEVRSYKQGCTRLGSNNQRNFSFTTELRYFFQYQGGEILEFTGDDDVWVFVNGKLAVDLGGMHSPESGRVVLGDDGRWHENGVPTDHAGEDSNCSSHGDGLPALDGCFTAEESADVEDTRFGLNKGEVYEIVLFHAERHTTGSNFRLTLDGFLAPRSFCSPICGDGIVSTGEVCDDGSNPNSADGDPSNDYSGACNSTCTALAHCGDGLLQIGELCDNGVNTDLYLQGDTTGACAPGCVLPPTCGDGVTQAAFELCDNGSDNSDTAYGANSCNTNCGLGAYCGDGVINGPELCDGGALNGTSYGADSCGYDCTQGPYCGDGIRNGPEECDGSENCLSDCTLAPYCGDGVVSSGESCDYGQFASNAYGGCTDQCGWGPGCGDGQLDSPFEECDDGIAENTGGYESCTAQCTFGPRCGDGVTQAEQGEECDSGFNDDTYAFSEDACGAGCQSVPYCGDGVVQSAFEACDHGSDNDDSAYEGCTTTCEWGAFCGDGTVDSKELCDDGLDNVFYQPEAGGCGYDCKPAGYCGDGLRNGPEQCDEGADTNTGEYGGCRTDCTRAPYCGDGVVQGNETCDDGPAGSLQCSTTCKSRTTLR